MNIFATVSFLHVTIGPEFCLEQVQLTFSMHGNGRTKMQMKKQNRNQKRHKKTLLYIEFNGNIFHVDV